MSPLAGSPVDVRKGSSVHDSSYPPSGEKQAGFLRKNAGEIFIGREITSNRWNGFLRHSTTVMDRDQAKLQKVGSILIITIFYYPFWLLIWKKVAVYVVDLFLFASLLHVLVQLRGIR